MKASTLWGLGVNSNDSEIRHPSLSYVGPRGVATLRCDGGPSVQLPGGLSSVKGPSDRLTVGMGGGGVLPGLCDRVSVSSFSP